MKERPYFVESTLPGRVRKYVDENKHVDIETMTEYLIKSYKEFRMKKKKPFMKSVEKAYMWEIRQDKRANEDDYSSPSSPDVIDLSIQEPMPGFSIDNLYKSNLIQSTPAKDKEAIKTLKNGKEITSFKNTKRKRKKQEEIEEVLGPENVQASKKRKKFESFIPETSLHDMKGISSLYKTAFKILAHLSENDLHSIAPKSILMTGPEGSGKTMFIASLAGEVKASLIRVSVSELSGAGIEGESLLKEVFTAAAAQGPCILLLENIDSLSSKETGISKGPDRKLCDQIKEAIREIGSKELDKPVLVAAETRQPQNVDPSLRSKFKKEITMPVLDRDARAAILKIMCPELQNNSEFEEIAVRTSSCVAGDLQNLVEIARSNAWDRVVEENLGKDVFSSPEKFRSDYFSFKTGNSFQNFHPQLQDFVNALADFTPTLKKEGFPLVPDTTWEDVGGLEDIKQELVEKILEPMQFIHKHEKFGARKPNGIMLWGPPGCGKTLLAKAVANHAGVNLYAVMGPELLNMYQGESERAIREVFKRAASVAPCVIFFDEFDCICPRRSAAGDSGSKMTIVNTLLVEMNGFNQRKDVYVMAATNRPDMVDPAVLRPERFDTSLYVGLPDRKGRIAVLKACTKNGKKPQLASDVDLEEIANWCENFSGADCAQLVYMASKIALREEIDEERISGKNVDDSEGGVGTLSKKHFVSAIKRVHPSIGPEEQKRYIKMKAKLESSRREGKEVILQDILSNEEAKCSK